MTLTLLLAWPIILPDYGIWEVVLVRPKGNKSVSIGFFELSLPNGFQAGRPIPLANLVKASYDLIAGDSPLPLKQLDWGESCLTNGRCGPSLL